jgi:hypothetical protein
METLNINASQKEKCGNYRVAAAELISPRGKNSYVRLSLKKVKRNGKIDRLGFSHYFNVGLPDLVPIYKANGVSDKGISDEDLAKALEGDDEDLFNFYGFFYNMPFGGTYRNKESGKIASETLMFVPCDEDTGIPKPEWAPTQARLNDILAGYERVADAAEEEAPSGPTTDADKQAEFEAWLKTQQK